MINTKVHLLHTDGDYYFVHSYEMICNKSSDIIATVNYGEEIVAMIGKENLLSVQFHPEKVKKRAKIY